MPTDIYESVTSRIVTALERGTPPWIKPWAAMPDNTVDVNHVSKKPYNGVNVLLLWAQRELAGYQRSRWLTFKQALERGGNVRRGEKGTQIVFWKFSTKPGEGDSDDEETSARSMLAKAYTVFNVEQCDGLELPELNTLAKYKERRAVARRLVAVRAFAANTGAVIKHGGDRAYYNRDRDTITLPKPETFKTPEDYSATKLHELTHWTGHASRCDRQFGKRFGDDAYAFEELVAELGGAFACAALRVNGKLQHDAYIANWLKVLKSDKRAVFTAASQARKAHEYLLALQPKKAEVAA